MNGPDMNSPPSRAGSLACEAAEDQVPVKRPTTRAAAATRDDVTELVLTPYLPPPRPPWGRDAVTGKWEYVLAWQRERVREGRCQNCGATREHYPFRCDRCEATKRARDKATRRRARSGAKYRPREPKRAVAGEKARRRRRKLETWLARLAWWEHKGYDVAHEVERHRARRRA